MSVNLQNLKSVVAAIIIFGHLSVFMFGFFIGIFYLIDGMDAIQTILMTTPILSTTALAALSNVLNQKFAEKNDRTRVNFLFSAICITFPTILIFLIFFTFYIFMIQIDGFGPDQLKIALGTIETFFGVYLGAIAKILFDRTGQ